MSDEKQWWEPELIDDDYIRRLRKDYPDKCAGMLDNEVLDYFNKSEQKYSTTWDHIGDAYNEYEPLADAYIEQKQKIAELKADLLRVCDVAENYNETIGSSHPDIPLAVIESLHHQLKGIKAIKQKHKLE